MALWMIFDPLRRSKLIMGVYQTSTFRTQSMRSLGHRTQDVVEAPGFHSVVSNSLDLLIHHWPVREPAPLILCYGVSEKLRGSCATTKFSRSVVPF